MPSATATAPKTAKVTETILRKEVRDPIEVTVAPSAPPAEPSEDFWRYLESLKDEDWKTHKVQLYRYPLGQTKPQKLGRYVKSYKAGCPLRGEEQIFEEFGGGQYDAMLTGPAKDGTGRITLLAKHSWEMDGPAKNPWQAASAAAGPSNSDLASTLQVVLQNLKAAERSPNIAGDPALKESISLIQQLTQAMKPEGIKELVAGLASLKQLTGDSGGDGAMLKAITLLKDLGVIGPDRERRSLATEIKEILEIAGMMGGGGAPAAGGGRVDWPTALVQNLPGILEKVTPIADKFADAARSNARVAELRSGRPVPPSSTTPTLPASAGPSAAATVPAAESPASRVVEAPETEPTTNPGQKLTAEPPNLVWVKARAVQMFGEGKTGDVIAEFLDLLDAQLGAFLGSMDEAKFRTFVETDPIMKSIATAPRYTSFVRDFVGYFQEEPGVTEPPTAE
jgi:hypothetical protein